MAVNLVSPLLPSVTSSPFQVLMEHFEDPAQLQDAINCSEDCAKLLKHFATPPLSDHCPVTQLCSTGIANEESRRLEEASGHVMGLLEETKQAVYVVKEMRQRVQNRKKRNMEKTKEVFSTLRRVIDQQEEQVIADIKEGTDKRDKALKVLLHYGMSVYCLNDIIHIILCNKNIK